MRDLSNPPRMQIGAAGRPGERCRRAVAERPVGARHEALVRELRRVQGVRRVARELRLRRVRARRRIGDGGVVESCVDRRGAAVGADRAARAKVGDGERIRARDRRAVRVLRHRHGDALDLRSRKVSLPPARQPDIARFVAADVDAPAAIGYLVQQHPARLRHVDRLGQEERRGVLDHAACIARGELDVLDDRAAAIGGIHLARDGAGIGFVLAGLAEGLAAVGGGDLGRDRELGDARVGLRDDGGRQWKAREREPASQRRHGSPPPCGQGAANPVIGRRAHL